jgi:hypothetical protein
LYRDRPIPAVSLNKGVLHSDSLAKYAAAFLRMMIELNRCRGIRQMG